MRRLSNSISSEPCISLWMEASESVCQSILSTAFRRVCRDPLLEWTCLCRWTFVCVCWGREGYQSHYEALSAINTPLSVNIRAAMSRPGASLGSGCVHVCYAAFGERRGGLFWMQNATVLCGQIMGKRSGSYFLCTCSIQATTPRVATNTPS